MVSMKFTAVVCAVIACLMMTGVIHADSEGYIQDWLVCGAFQGDDIQKVTDPIFSKETFPDIDSYSVGKVWKQLHAQSMPVDFNKASLNWEGSDHCTAYAAVYVYSPAPQDASLLVGCDDLYAAWLNGNEVGRSDQWQSWTVDKYKNPVALRSGWNMLMLRITNGTSFWQFSARIVDAMGNAVTNLKYQTQNPDPNGLFAHRSNLGADLRILSAGIESNGTIVDSRMLVNVRMLVANVGSKATDSHRVVAKDAMGGVLVESALPTLDEDRSITVVMGIPYEKLLQAAMLSKQQINVECGGSRVAVPLPQTDVVAMLFRPIRYEWTAKLTDGQVLPAQRLTQEQLKRVSEYSAKSSLPAFLKGYAVSAGIDIGWECVGRMIVNGKEVKDHFSGDSGDILAVKKGSHESQIDLLVPVKSGGQPRYDNGWLRVHIPEIENYLKSYQFAQILLKNSNTKTGPELNGISAALLSMDAKKVTASVVLASRPIDYLAPAAKAYTAHLLGHAHIDLAWLWQTKEMIQVTKDTFKSALSMMDRYPDFRFSQSSAATYWWMEQYAPEILAQIKRRAQQGRWDPVGGMWSECDSNMPSGESLVRQFLYGQRYMKSKLGVAAQVGWGPDTFGHALSLPQILTKGGMDGYKFMRCRPFDSPFWWVGLDGTRVFCSPTDNYNGQIGEWIGERLVKNEAETKGSKVITVEYGVGDHGGGPTIRDIETAKAFDSAKVYPNMKFDSAARSIKAEKAQKNSYPVYTKELNSIFVGCYTSQAAVKKANRELESLLPEAEVFSVISTRYGGSYPSGDFFTAWRHTLFNQFHDIMDGSGIHPIYDDAAAEHKESISLGQKALTASLDIITLNINIVGDSVVVYNPMAWPRTDVVELPNLGNLPMSIGDTGDCQLEDNKLVFIARDVPAMGYKVYPIRRGVPPVSTSNPAYMVTASLDPSTGSISSAKDAAGRELFVSGKPGNDLFLHRETGDGWNIYPTGKIDKITSNAVIDTIVQGPVRSIKHVTLKQDSSEYTQDIVQYASLPRLDIQYKVHWQDRGTMLKAAFSLDIAGATARFEIPFGSITRPSDGSEVVTQKWVDLSNKDYGVALLNDSKYGVDVKNNTINMTLLRQPSSPDPNGDIGEHEFRLALYPHKGDWASGDVVRRGYEFNNPLIAVRTGAHTGSLPAAHSYLEGSANVVVTAMKKAEDSNDLVVRFYEHAGKGCTAAISLDRAIASAVELDNMEWKQLGKMTVQGNKVIATMKPWEYKTVRIKLR